MEFVCRRCNRFTKQKPYRVTSEEGGLVVLNMLVCASCARLAKKLGLPVAKAESPQKAAKAKRVEDIRDSERQPAQPPRSIR
jgi:hypothetical protein